MEEVKKSQWVFVGRADAIPLREGRRVRYGDHEIALFNLGGEYRAVQNRCPHKNGPLADGIVAGTSVFCPLHNWRIDLETGCALNENEGPVRTYPVKVLDQNVYVAF